MSYISGVYYGAYSSDGAGETKSNPICIAVYWRAYGLLDRWISENHIWILKGSKDMPEGKSVTIQ